MYIYTTTPAQANSGFNPDLFLKLYNLENGNFWFQSRNDRIIYLIEKYMKEPFQFLEIGCGTGFVLESLNTKFRNSKIIGSDIFIEGLKYARERNPKLYLIQMDAKSIPLKSKFDCIGMFDVLEHIEDDKLVLEQCYKALKENGLLFITVPQHMFLWSQKDVIACHKCRYSRKELTNILNDAKFKILYNNSFTSLLFPFMVIARIFQKNTTNPEFEFKIPQMLNICFKIILKFEFLLIQLGIRFPFGGSLIMIGKKINEATYPIQ